MDAARISHIAKQYSCTDYRENAVRSSYMIILLLLISYRCAACWSYKFTEQITEQIVGYEEIDTVDQDQLEICSQTFGLPKDVILSFGRDFMCMICPAA